MAINIQEGSCLHLGKIWRRAVVTPDLEALVAASEGNEGAVQDP